MPDVGSGTPAAAPSSPLATRFYALYAKFPRLKWGRPDIPSTMVGAYWGLLVSAAFGLITGLVLQTQTGWYREIRADAVARSVAKGDNPPLVMPTATQMRQELVGTLVAIAIVAVVLAIIAYSVSRGTPSSRWFLTAVWAVATLGIMAGLSIYGIPQTISFIIGGAPIVLVIPSAICSLTLLFAFVSVLSKPSRHFFAAAKAAKFEQAVTDFDARKAARAQGGPRPSLFGRRRGFAQPSAAEIEQEAEFAPRPPRPGTEGTPKRKVARQAASAGDDVAEARSNADDGAPSADGVSLVKDDGPAGPEPDDAATAAQVDGPSVDDSGLSADDAAARRPSTPRSKSRASGS